MAVNHCILIDSVFISARERDISLATTPSVRLMIIPVCRYIPDPDANDFSRYP